MSGPLEGINALDFGQAGVGPWAGTLLSWLGANVIKIERPEGDVILGQAPRMNGLGVGYSVWNMSKKSAILDLKTPEGRKALEPLVRSADIVSENLRPGVLDRLGAGFAAVSAINPRIVYGRSPGWGLTGPLADNPGTDADFQAFTGFGSMSGDEGGRPEMARHAYHFDLNASAFLAANIVLGLIQRERTGLPQLVTSSHLGSTMSQMSTRAAEYLLTGQIPEPLGSAASVSAPNQAFLCENKRWLAVGVENDRHWRALCSAVRREDLFDDPRYANNLDRVAHRTELAAELSALFASRPSWWWNSQLTKHGVPVGHFYDFEDIRNHAQVVENQFIVEMDIPHQGKLLAGGLPWRFSQTPSTMYASPFPGEHTDEVVEKGFGLFGAAPPTASGSFKPNDATLPPLSGYRVIDASQGMCGPYVALLLADSGAEVIKVEPPTGDYARAFAPRTATGNSAVFETLNRNKRSIVLDLGTGEGQAELRELLRTADVLIEDWGAGRAAELGFDERTLSGINPGLVVCGITPFGDAGPFAKQAGSELIVQAMSDYWLSLGTIGEPPVRWGSDSAYLTTGSMAFLGTLAALFNRDRTGAGQRVGVSMLGTMICLREACWSVMSDVSDWEGPFALAYTSPRWHGWKTRDKQLYFRLHRASEEEYSKLLLELGMEEQLFDERFANAGRDAVGMGKYAVEVQPIWDEHLGKMDAESVIALVRKYNALAVPFNTIPDVVDHPQVRAAGIMKELRHPVLGTVRVVDSPIQGSWTAPEPSPAPALGEYAASTAAL